MPSERGDLPMRVQQIRDALRTELAERMEGRDTLYALELSEADALDLASGYVPEAVKAMCLAMLDWAEEDQRRAHRPRRTRK